MIVQVLADARQVRDDGDPKRAQVIGGADARQQEELRRPDCPAAHDDVPRACRLDAAVSRPLDPYAARALEQQAPRGRAREHLEVSLGFDRTEVRRRSTVANALLDAVLHERHAVLRSAVVVRVQRDAALFGCGCDRAVDRVRLERRQQAHRARPAGLPPFDPFIDRAHVVPRPAVGPEIRPGVEVGGCPPHPDHRVETARSAQHAAARPREPPVVRVHLRLRLVRPVDLREPELMHPAGVMDRRALVRARRPRAGERSPHCPPAGARRRHRPIPSRRR